MPTNVTSWAVIEMDGSAVETAVMMVVSAVPSEPAGTVRVRVTGTDCPLARVAEVGSRVKAQPWLEAAESETVSVRLPELRKVCW